MLLTRWYNLYYNVQRSCFKMYQRRFSVRLMLAAFLCICQTKFGACRPKVSAPGDAVAGRPFTLKCSINRTIQDSRAVIWRYSQGPSWRYVMIYSSGQCTQSIPLSVTYPAGLSGGCNAVNGEEVYSLTAQNVTQATGLIRWQCTHGSYSSTIRLDIKVTVKQVNLMNPPDTVLEGNPTNFTCVTSASKPQACIMGFLRSSGNVRELDPRDCDQDSNSMQNTCRTLLFTPSMEDNGAELYCNASNNVTDPPVRSGVYPLNVQCVPKLTCTKTDVIVLTGQRVVLSCDVISKPEANVIWLRNGKQIDGASSTYSRSLTFKHMATSQIRLGEADRMTPGTYQVAATNEVGSTRVDIKLTVIEEEFLPDAIQVLSCSGGQATLVWASGIEKILVEFYKLEYAGENEIWERELVRNPGRVKLVKKTLTSLQSGVWYQFRLQPHTDPETSRYATSNCTVHSESPLGKETASPGISNTGMLGVGVAVGVTFVTVNGLWVTCVLLYKKKLVSNSAKPKRPLDKIISRNQPQRSCGRPTPPVKPQQSVEKINSRNECPKGSMARPTPPGCHKKSLPKNEKITKQQGKTECYEILHMTPHFGQEYEDMPGNRIQDTELVYENSN